jgi:uncharacterized paraquat-inducible protein A
MIKYTCPYCGNLLEIPDEFAGRAALCKKCNNKIRVPKGYGQIDEMWEAAQVEESKPPERDEWVTVTQTAPSGTIRPALGTSNAAFASLLLGIFSFSPAALLFSIPGAVFGHMALTRIRQAPGVIGGKGMAVAGLVLSYINIGLSALIILGVLLLYIFTGGLSSTSYSGPVGPAGLRAPRNVPNPAAPQRAAEM